uniref:Uncharacterized protein n=1 Tax=Anguilla anguilla TaxID=7936 RepID=A0A0E9Q1B6_ANGAN
MSNCHSGILAAWSILLLSLCFALIFPAPLGDPTEVLFPEGIVALVGIVAGVLEQQLFIQVLQK